MFFFTTLGELEYAADCGEVMCTILQITREYLSPRIPSILLEVEVLADIVDRRYSAHADDLGMRVKNDHVIVFLFEEDDHGEEPPEEYLRAPILFPED